MVYRQSTKTEAEKEDEQAEAHAKPTPKLKPPRYDRRNRRMETEDDDISMKEEKKELSMKNARIATEQAICRLAMQFRQIAPDLEDVNIISSSVEGDISDPAFWPRLAKATFNHIDQKYRNARYRRIVPSADGRRFEMGAPRLPRTTDDPTWPVWTKQDVMKPASVTEVDLDEIVRIAQANLDPVLARFRREMAFRQALDMAIGTLDQGRFQNTIDAPLYLELLNRMAGSAYDLKTEVYVPSDIDQGEKSAQPHGTDPYDRWSGEPLDPYKYWGRPADSFIDPGVTKDEAWRKHFEHAGPYEFDADEPYMETLENPTV